MKNKVLSSDTVVSLEPKARKSFLASSYKKNLTLLGVAAVILLLTFSVYYLGQPILVIYDQQTGESFVEVPTHTDDLLEYNWIHSFEHIPWKERYRIMDNHKLQLVEIQVAGFGAGIPENKGKMTVENGMVIMRELEDRFDYISWINSNTALSSIVLNGKTIVLGSEMPHHHPLKLEIKRRLNTWLTNR
ncbi:DUF1850 domain-containing protein [Acidaminobacter hydrogenoformans]|uniref:DUF1850 domain-containing protein n=1 Tax=Acidaminobacter hydrogenoformans DSM 2784 TaxID=1120920 RepID=A0A1G5RVU3_9FIRM|nr:DUF1850 domain-containing protein [Acidaminobacter hydrogenoformans]SCZ77978.1 hypothetical protein SAMN03080599_01039 [Acidaminobacter hydrogenoformans DSM 2784]